jgi:hypothetical protein
MESVRRLAIGLLLLSTASGPVANSPPSRVDGTWDLTWQTRKGPSQSGYLVIRQNGSKLSAEIHGKGAIRASGSASGRSFSLFGTKMLVRYEISGTWTADDMTGELKVLSVERHFTGKRRRVP